jgi:uroporphyrinogen decarboxylase
MSEIKKTLNGEINSCVPIWFMRQAGRYLPEFRSIRKKNKDFIKLCLDANLSSEITLQPIKRFNLDAAIIFSDILMVPYALGQSVNFVENLGPVLSEFKIDEFLKKKENDFTKTLNPVYEAIKKTRENLNKNKSLISFVGSPWTLVIYMFGIKKSKEVLDSKLLISKKAEIDLVMKKIIEFLKIHIKNQVDAGADIIQIFDSWAGLVPEENIDNYCYEPNQILVEYCKKLNIPVICFPKGIGNKYATFSKIVKPNCVSIDFNLDPEWAKKNLNGICIQGGMDPNILLSNKDRIIKEAEKFLNIFKGYPYIFNLGHGLLPQTNPDNVNELVNFVKNYEYK